MNKRIKRTLSVLVAVLLLISTLPVTALAAVGSTDISANVKHPLTVTLTPHPGGTVNIIAPTTIYKGDEVSFTANPEPGYALKSMVWYTDDPMKATDITETKKLNIPNANVNVKVEFAQLFTVSFDMQGHGTQVSPITGVMDGTTVTAPAAPTAGGYTFGGWYKESGCKTAWNFGADTVKKNTTLYAKWIADSVPKQAIGGNVTEDSKNVPGATVELFLGTVKVAATVTDKDGKYNFENVENGTYNIVVTKEDGKTKTEMVTISDNSATVNVELPTSEISSKVEHKGNEVSGAKSDISKTVVGGLDTVAEKHKPQNDSDKVTVKLTVEPKADTGTPKQQAIKKEAGEGKKVEFLDLSLLMQTNGGEPKDIGDENDELLTIVIPFDFTNVYVTSVMILRNHGGQTEKLSETENAYGEYVKINEADGNITLYVMKFSDYAVAFDTIIDEDECVRTETVKLTENGTYGMKLNCCDKGEFSFTKDGSGWTIQNSDGKYLTMKDSKLILSTEPFAWTYKNGAFSTSVKTKQKNSGYWWGWIYIPGHGSKTVTTTYYLSTVTNGVKLSTCLTCAELYQTITGEHDFGCWIDCKDGKNHKHICKNCGKVETEAHSYNDKTYRCICGAYNQEQFNVDIKVDFGTKFSKKYIGFWPWGYYKNVRAYTAAIKTDATGVRITKVMYQINCDKWMTGTFICSDEPIKSIKVKAWDNNGNMYEYQKPNCF